MLYLASKVCSYASFIQMLVYLPLALDIAGLQCFLALSVSLAAFYGAQATFQLFVRNTRWAWTSRTLSLTQLIALPAILLLCLNLYSANTASVETLAWGYRLLARVPTWWERTLRWSSGLFVVLEGISTLLVIQSFGQLSRYFVDERGEGWQFVFLITSATTYVLSAYFLWSAYGTAAVESLNATLIGVSVTSVVFLSGIAFALRKGNVVETSLMMAYIVFNIFYLGDSPDPVTFIRSSKTSLLLPPVLLQSVGTIISVLSATFGQGLDFISAASSALPLPVIVGLVYRIVILYGAGRVVIAMKRAKDGYDESTRLSEEEPFGRTVTIVIAYSKVILVSVYTHLILLNNQGGHVYWRWITTRPQAIKRQQLGSGGCPAQCQLDDRPPADIRWARRAVTPSRLNATSLVSCRSRCDATLRWLHKLQRKPSMLLAARSVTLMHFDMIHSRSQ
ncbi:uncharacterized protein L969DRAFT_61585 [Mixia osmundae IAM 14324]|uniref:Uncharacterized protein n=1 Tax=Mixia osmundae (strain CBS 9802 / IAM 14324 / JCM 22182 / KY 12970) TaxID=764103 RepID=G7E6E3_MIXOS|nr:uncharacterized protein L969DRAFT_61585 [Mixia osmundae IAM 14324]KEI40439.1 hypothetical protein L969DRAFT_61585 [Mixia osmundae IAM 14324]GAA98403.1 hypothetical protein E5Q_05089 [Mixia osmundae IAM 14324]